MEPAAELASQALESVQRARWSLVQLRHTYVCILDTYLATSQPARYASRIEIALAKLRGWRDGFHMPCRTPCCLPRSRLAPRQADPAHGRAIPQEHHDRRKLGMRMEPAVAQYWLGCFAQSSAGASWVPEGAEPHLRAALATFEHFKAAGMVSRTQAALQSRCRPAKRSGISRRHHRRVAGLAVAGDANPGIAQHGSSRLATRDPTAPWWPLATLTRPQSASPDRPAIPSPGSAHRASGHPEVEHEDHPDEARHVRGTPPECTPTLARDRQRGHAGPTERPPFMGPAATPQDGPLSL